MSNYSAQNSITIKRLRNGDTFFISFDTNKVPLFQNIDPNTETISPSWEIGTGPILIPRVISARDNDVTFTRHTWSYNSLELTFPNPVTDSDRIELTVPGEANKVVFVKSNNDPKFAIAENNSGALAIIGNLASPSNIASDILLYSCTVRVAGVEYDLTKSVDIAIQNAGSTSYYGTLVAETEQLTGTIIKTDIIASLFSGGTPEKTFYVKWFKDSEEFYSDTENKTGSITSTTTGSTSREVTRTDIDGTQLFIAEFYINNPDLPESTSVFRTGIKITDTTDEYRVEHRYKTASPREVSKDKPVTLEAYVVNMNTQNVLSSSDGKNWNWVSNIMDKDTWTPINNTPITSNTATNQITITTAETDRDGVEKDVEVVSEVEWSI